ncbi:hypothetical protein NDU88_007310 [Pleurodeles waltl]|uniref:Uncharacterized protein n=1 Tax=Pleurodeles waltl TaxID=8319 RepID=A0AAV7WGP4_PLEWA|nr:hypothetical protein NDU88_007310 [Pleurodeles waltl]
MRARPRGPRVSLRFTGPLLLLAKRPTASQWRAQTAPRETTWGEEVLKWGLAQSDYRGLPKNHISLEWGPLLEGFKAYKMDPG